MGQETKDHEGGMRNTATNPGVSLPRATLSDQGSLSLAPLPAAVSPHPTLSSKNTAEAGVLNYT